MKKRSTVYVEQELHRDFKDICKREGVSMSEKTESMYAQYVMLHKKGNPQMMLESFGSELRVVCVRCQKSFPEREMRTVLYKSGWETKSCRACIRRDKARGLVKKVRRE